MTNTEIEQAISNRLREYPDAAAADINWLLTETARLRDAAADEYRRRVAADESATRTLLAKTDLQARIRQQSDVIHAQSAELSEQAAVIRKLGQDIAALRGQPDAVLVGRIPGGAS